MNRARGRRRVVMSTNLGVTSMMDMFVIILLFLLMFFDPAATPDPEFRLPSSVVTTPVGEGLRVRLRRDAVEVAGRDVLALRDGLVLDATGRSGRRIEAVEGALAAARTQDNAEVPLLVECDESVPWSTLGDVLASAAAAGFEGYRFVVLAGSATPGAAAP